MLKDHSPGVIISRMASPFRKAEVIFFSEWASHYQERIDAFGGDHRLSGEYAGFANVIEIDYEECSRGVHGLAQSGTRSVR
jgi:hypothetical protein